MLEHHHAPDRDQSHQVLPASEISENIRLSSPTIS